jgi:hypothetical protein
MPDLIHNLIDINNPDLVKKIISAFRELIDNVDNLYKLKIQNGVYFYLGKINSNQRLPIDTNAGWYIILDNFGNPLYVGTAKNLNKRLNTNNNTIDNFFHTNRKSDCKRNFIKKFLDIEIISELYVFIISENALIAKLGRDQLGIPFNQNENILLKKRDRENIETILDIFRSSITVVISEKIYNP